MSWQTRTAGSALLAALLAGSCYDHELAPLRPEPASPTGPTVEWWKTIASSGEDTTVVDFIRSDGHIVAAGTFRYQVALGRGEPGEITLDTGVEQPEDGGTVKGYGAYIAQYHRSGSLMWAKPLAATGQVSVQDIESRRDGSFVLTGNFSDTLTFDPRGASPIALSAGSGQNIFVAQYDSSGAILWARSEGSSRWDNAISVTTSAAPLDLILVAGAVDGAATFGEGMDTLVLEHYDDSHSQGFIAAYETDGTLRWVTSIYGESTISDVEVAGDYAYVTGWFAGQPEFRSAQGEPNRQLTSRGENDVFFGAYELATGNLSWVRQAGGTGIDEGCAIQVLHGFDDEDIDGSIFLAGSFQKKPHLDDDPPEDLPKASATDVFLARYDPPGAHGGSVDGGTPDGGALRWALNAVSSEGREACSDLAVHHSGTEESLVAILTGGFSGSYARVNGLSGDNLVDIYSEGFDDGFVAYYRANGDLGWARRMGGPSLRDAAWSASVHANSVLISGGWERKLTFGVDESDTQTLLDEPPEDGGATESFLMRLQIKPSTQ